MSLKFECPDCGPQDHLLFDASTIMERAFEGLWFVLKKDPETGALTASGQPEDAKYLSDFNMPKHLAEAAALAEDERTSVYCPKCQEPLE